MLEARYPRMVRWALWTSSRVFAASCSGYGRRTPGCHGCSNCAVRTRLLRRSSCPRRPLRRVWSRWPHRWRTSWRCSPTGSGPASTCTRCGGRTPAPALPGGCPPSPAAGVRAWTGAALLTCPVRGRSSPLISSATCSWGCTRCCPATPATSSWPTSTERRRCSTPSPTSRRRGPALCRRHWRSPSPVTAPTCGSFSPVWSRRRRRGPSEPPYCTRRWCCAGRWTCGRTTGCSPTRMSYPRVASATSSPRRCRAGAARTG